MKSITLLPAGGEVKIVDSWCKAMERTATPTLFIKGHKLPDAYSIGDLQYFLQSDE